MVHLLIVAAGSGSRMGADRNKLLLEIAGRPILAWTLNAILQAESIDWVGIVGQPRDKEMIFSIIESYPQEIAWIDGGSTRQESVQLGLAGLPAEAEFVLIHDGARCLVKSSLVNKCAQAVIRGDAVIAASPVTDTIKRVNSQGLILDTPPRSDLWSAQTPQGFSVAQLREAHKKALANGWTVTDDASLYERLGLPVKILNAGPSNIKVTTPFDLLVAEAFLSTKEEE